MLEEWFVVDHAVSLFAIEKRGTGVVSVVSAIHAI
jgi:hypothetical protein